MILRLFWRTKPAEWIFFFGDFFPFRRGNWIFGNRRRLRYSVWLKRDSIDWLKLIFQSNNSFTIVTDMFSLTTERFQVRLQLNLIVQSNHRFTICIAYSEELEMVLEQILKWCWGIFWKCWNRRGKWKWKKKKSSRFCGMECVFWLTPGRRNWGK